MDGKGEVFDSEGTRLINREVIPLDAVPDLDTTNPKKQVFTLFYRSTSTKRSELKFFLRDNFNQKREMNITFDVESSSSEQ